MSRTEPIFFAVYDKVAKIFMPPSLFNSEMEALRVFRDCTLEDGHAFFKNPKDYCLMRLGSFNPLDGRLSMEEAPVMIVKAQSFVKKKGNR